jgi:hypothetical protein
MLGSYLVNHFGALHGGWYRSWYRCVPSVMEAARKRFGAFYPDAINRGFDLLSNVNMNHHVLFNEGMELIS